MSRGKEVAVLLLDVGPAMAPHLGVASRMLSHYLLSKMVNKPGHEVALVFFGTTGTHNALHQEFLESEGDDQQYRNITTAVPLSVTSVEEHLQAAAGVAPGEGPSDLLNALTVACDVLSKAIQARPELEKRGVVTRVLVFSCFQGPTQEDEDGEFVAQLTEQLQQMHVQLDVVTVAGEGGGEPQAEPGTAAALAGVLLGVRHTRRVVRGPLELLAACRFKEYAATAYYSGPLELSCMEISVKACKKTSQERPPSMECVVAATGDAVVLARQAVRAGDGGDEPGALDVVEMAETGKGYRYGTDVVPFDSHMEQMLRLPVEKSFKVLGAVPLDSVPAAVFLSDTWLVVPDKTVLGAHSAVAALTGQLRAQRLALLARFAPRLNAAVSIGLLTPMPPEPGRPAALLMRTLPFEDDVRAAAFPSFDAREELLPDVEQTAATDAFIDALGLGLADGEHDLLAPEQTGNPSLHRFLDRVGQRALGRDTGAAPPDDGGLADRTLRARLDSPEAQRAAERMAELFHVAPAAAGGAEPHAAREPATTVGTTAPKQDFEDLLGRDVDAAFLGMAAAIRQLATADERAKSQKLAVECLQRLRGAAAKLPRAQQFNRLLEELAQACEAHPRHGGFWAAAMAEAVRPLTEEEAEGGVPPAEADAFWRRHCETQPMDE